MKQLMISGAGGFLAGHLWPRLAGRFRLIGVDLPGVRPRVDGQWLPVAASEDLADAVERTRPDILIHAAFVNRKPDTWSERRYLDEVLAVNGPLFEACADRGVALLLVSSSAVYGNLAGRVCLDEQAPRQPVSLYGVGKALQEMMAEYRAASGGLRLCVARLFNLIGPGQKRGMLLPDWVSQVKRIGLGAEPVLCVRHQNTSRDFIDARDAADALVRLADDFRPGETVNVASGQAVSLREIGAFLKTLTPVDFEIRSSEAEPSGTDISGQRGNAEKLKRHWGWEPAIDWKQSILDLWDTLDESE